VPESPRAQIENSARRIAKNLGKNIFTEAAARFDHITPTAHHHHPGGASLGGYFSGIPPPKEPV
jgi:hypothetical protein